ncbi:hypothetical protein LEMA_P029390.1 [Plenodomus lingam JN3]|uniref:Amidase domain-containing protein n=1 Tax=Leptosphaeria maculans (strain JN3 / isolate v23.1.3 / race Av1-4-5-6-7-8) TaxID=985895 RepID=E4ZW11_LEPMJ|nr:hypothetical protein LEMA_P029390.1 [Plenodomus lingam JN3]CBX95787.1 hypothetical protein LEMA_P029390.1 [Plenodomus lingam JN3]
MAASEPPQWLLTVDAKRKLRDDAIQKYLDGQNLRSEVRHRAPDACYAPTSTSMPILVKFNNQTIITPHFSARSMLTSGFTEILFDHAIKQAKELDEYHAKSGRLIGPLHGVPITLKDQFNVKGYDSTLSYVGRAFKPAAHGSLIVSIL